MANVKKVPLAIKIKVRIISYWTRLISIQERSLNHIMYNIIKICIDNNINMYKCLLDSNYYSFVKKQMCSSPNQHEDGYIDTLRMLLKDRNEENMTLLKFLLKPY